jgi:hypothetical protein
MPGLVPGIHAFTNDKKDVDGRDKPGHDEISQRKTWSPSPAFAGDPRGDYKGRLQSRERPG